MTDEFFGVSNLISTHCMPETKQISLWTFIRPKLRGLGAWRNSVETRLQSGHAQSSGRYKKWKE